MYGCTEMSWTLCIFKLCNLPKNPILGSSDVDLPFHSLLPFDVSTTSPSHAWPSHQKISSATMHIHRQHCTRTIPRQLCACNAIQMSLHRTASYVARITSVSSPVANRWPIGGLSAYTSGPWSSVQGNSPAF